MTTSSSAKSASRPVHWPVPAASSRTRPRGSNARSAVADAVGIGGERVVLRTRRGGVVLGGAGAVVGDLLVDQLAVVGGHQRRSAGTPSVTAAATVAVASASAWPGRERAVAAEQLGGRARDGGEDERHEGPAQDEHGRRGGARQAQHAGRDGGQHAQERRQQQDQDHRRLVAGTRGLHEAHDALVGDRDRQRQQRAEDGRAGADHERAPSPRSARPRAMRYDLPAPMTSTASPLRRGARRRSRWWRRRRRWRWRARPRCARSRRPAPRRWSRPSPRACRGWRRCRR